MEHILYPHYTVSMGVAAEVGLLGESAETEAHLSRKYRSSTGAAPSIEAAYLHGGYGI